MEEFLNIFSYFIIYSILGWICELVWCSIQEKRIVKNRGFLFGPYCPIYGIGALIILYFLGNYQNDILALFLISMIVCSILEYFTSYVMEKLFNERWWDYSNMKFNIEGRVCLLNSISFGVLAVLLVHYMQPFFSALINTIPSNVHVLINATVFIIFTFDLTVTLIGVLKLRKILKSIKIKKTRPILFKKSLLKYGEELFTSRSKFTLLNIKNILKRFPKLVEPRDKDIGVILKKIIKRKK